MLKWRRFLLCAVLIGCAMGCLLENGRSSVYLSVFEDLKPGERIGVIPVEGFKKNGNIDLRVVKGGDVVEFEPGGNHLKLVSPLDRDEGVGKIEAVVECKSQLESDFNQLNISVFITVKDVNDNAPVFDQPEYHVNISEELPIGTIVFTDISATDNDQPGPNSFLQYTILPSEHSNLLDIEDPFKPIITVKNRIDYEKVQQFSVQIQAHDQGEPSLSSVVPLRVTVEDQNDLNPHFEHDYYIARRVKDGVLLVTPAPIKAVDGDALRAPIVYSLAGELSTHFAINRDGEIRVRNNPPPPLAVFYVHAYEEDNRERNATTIIKVQLGSSIHFENDLYNLKMSSNTPPGTVLHRIKAFSETNSQLKYSLTGREKSFIKVEPFSGTLTMGKAPLQLKAFYEYNITASDGTDEALARVHVFVDAVADCTTGPRFERAEHHAESADALKLLGPLKTNTEHVSYELLNMKRDFLISGDGVLTVRQGSSLQCNVCELVVVARDQQGRVGFTKVVVRNSGFVVSTSSALTCLILFIVIVIFLIMFSVIVKKVSYVWKQNKRQRMCWLNRSTDSGVVITGTMPPNTTRYVVNPEKESRVADISAAKSPAPPRSNGAHLVPVTVTNHDGAPTVYF